MSITLWFLVVYWILSIICTTYLLIKYPSGNESEEYFTLLDLLLYILISAFFGWLITPIALFSSVKFKRFKNENKKGKR